MKGELNLTISSVNVNSFNSFNISTLGGENNKTYLKIEGIYDHVYVMHSMEQTKCSVCSCATPVDEWCHTSNV